jgi:excinuclease ABC subunit B
VRDLTMRLTGKKVAEPTAPYATAVRLPEHELSHLILDLEEQMREAAQQLEFEKAAALRDQILELKQQSIA